jgi:hypothetical protein
MKLLFNEKILPAVGSQPPQKSGPQELKELTGSYYANNDWSRVKMDVVIESENLIKFIGDSVYNLAADFYLENAAPERTPAFDYQDFLDHLRYPIAIAAVNRFYQGNIVSHEDTGRKLKLDKNKETVPWQWMLDKDDQAHERKAVQAADRLFNYLDKIKLEEWVNSDLQKSTRNLFVNNTAAFQKHFPIDESPKFYYTVVPFITKIQTKVIAKILGAERYTALLTWYQSPPSEASGSEEIEKNILLTYIQEAIVFLTMAEAVVLLSLKVLPAGVVQEFSSMVQTKNASQAVLLENLKFFSKKIAAKADLSLDELKVYALDSDEKLDFDLLPKNPTNQKYCRT